MTKPHVAQPSMPQPTIVQPPVAQPSMPQPTIVQPPVAQPTVSKPAVAQVPLTQPTVTKPAVAQVPVTQPPMVQPTASKPPVAQLIAQKPIAVQPAVAQGVVSQPTTAQPKTAQPVPSKATPTQEPPCEPHLANPRSSEHSSYLPLSTPRNSEVIARPPRKESEKSEDVRLEEQESVSEIELPKLALSALLGTIRHKQKPIEAIKTLASERGPNRPLQKAKKLSSSATKRAIKLLQTSTVTLRPGAPASNPRTRLLRRRKDFFLAVDAATQTERTDFLRVSRLSMPEKPTKNLALGSMVSPEAKPADKVSPGSLSTHRDSGDPSPVLSTRATIPIERPNRISMFNPKKENLAKPEASAKSEALNEKLRAKFKMIDIINKVQQKTKDRTPNVAKNVSIGSLGEIQQIKNTRLNIEPFSIFFNK